MMRGKQHGNPEFAFLYGGEYSLYYAWSSHVMRSGTSPEIAGHQLTQYTQQQHALRAAAVQQYMSQFSPQDSTAFDTLVQQLTRSKDSIQGSKDWILARCTCADAITTGLRERCEREPDPDRRQQRATSFFVFCSPPWSNP